MEPADSSAIYDYEQTPQPEERRFNMLSQRKGNIPNVGLGRKKAVDPRDYSLQPLLSREKIPTDAYKYWWDEGVWLDQRTTPQCVAYAWTHWLADGPVTQKGLFDEVFAEKVYRECQLVDEWNGENYDGTSVRAGAKVLQKMGYIQEYRFGNSLSQLIDVLSTQGPCVIGISWMEGMFFPHQGVIRAFGGDYGGHALLANGFNRDKEVIRLKNSWGRGWGTNGQCWIPFEDLEYLFSLGAEICFATETRLKDKKEKE